MERPQTAALIRAGQRTGGSWAGLGDVRGTVIDGFIGVLRDAGGRADACLWQASSSALRTYKSCSWRASTAYSNSRIEFSVPMPICITKPIIDGTSN